MFDRFRSSCEMSSSCMPRTDMSSRRKKGMMAPGYFIMLAAE